MQVQEELGYRYEIQMKDLDGKWNNANYSIDHTSNPKDVLKIAANSRPNRAFRLVQIKMTVIEILNDD